MATEIRMPQLGLTMTEGTLASWKKNVGDTVKVGDVLAEIETDKLSTELESEVEGVILALIVKDGDLVPVQAVLAYVGAPGEKVDAAPAAKPAPVEVAAPAATSAVSTAGAAPVAATPNTPATKTEGGRVRISPLAKKIAADNNVDCSTLAGTGPGGRIVRRDVLSAMASAPQAAPVIAASTSASAAVAGGRRERMTSMRKVVADRMFKSHSEIPVVTQNVKTDVTELLEFRKHLNEKHGRRFSVNDFVLKAVAKALSQHRNVLVSIDGTDIVHHDHVNIGMAVALDSGLIVPVIRDADKLSMEAIATTARDLAERARSGNLQAEEYQGSTFSISNLGMFGVESFTPIINQPNAAILGIGSIDDELALIDGQPVARKKMRLCLTYDHRLLDGAAAANFQLAVKQLLEQPLDIIL